MNFILKYALFINFLISSVLISQDLNTSTNIKVLKKWSKEFISGVSFPVIKKENKLIIPLLDGNLQILDFNTGQRINRYNLGKGPILEMSHFNSNLTFIMPLEKKSLRIYNIDSEKYVLKKKIKFPLKYCIQNERDSLIIGNDHHIVSINKFNGEENWFVKFQTPIVSKPYISNEEIIILNELNEILILSLQNGKIISRNQIDKDFLPKEVLRALLLKKDNNFYVATFLGNIFSLNIKEIKNNWLVDLQNQIYSSLILNNENVIISDASGRVVSLAISDGSINWDYNTKLLINQDPIIINDLLMIITEVGKIFFFDQSRAILLSSNEIDGRIIFAKKLDESNIIVADDSKKISLFEIKNN